MAAAPLLKWLHWPGVDARSHAELTKVRPGLALAGHAERAAAAHPAGVTQSARLAPRGTRRCDTIVMPCTTRDPQ
eukprot:782951-Prorocentrum_minimum.AAC.1